MNISTIYKLLLPILVSAITACTADVAPDRHMQDEDDLMWTIKLNHRAINLTTTPPYDTVTLNVAAYNMHGIELQGVKDVSIEVLSENIVIHPNNVLQALKQTTASGVLVLAKVTHNGVTLEDTARVVATTATNPPQLVSLNPQLGDEREYVTALHMYDVQESAILPNIIGSGGSSIPRAILHYRPRLENGLSIVFEYSWDGGSFGAMLPGLYKVDIDGFIYGKKVTDSISIKVLDRRITMHKVLKGLGIPRESFISVGGGVYWFNHTDDSLDIVFDDPSSASSACCTLIAFMLNRSESGNVAPFLRDMSLPLKGPCSFICLDRIAPDVIQGRSFHEPGRYKYHSTRNPNVWGTVVVNDKYTTF